MIKLYRRKGEKRSGVVGTEVATKLLEDGDNVEVDTQSGIIIKLK